MMSPSDEERIVAMVDSFTKTVARNFSRNLKRAKANAEKHYSDEPVDYWANQAAYRWKLRGMCMWSLGQEDMRLWEWLPKQTE